VAKKFGAFDLQQQSGGFIGRVSDLREKSTQVGTFAVVNLSNVMDRMAVWSSALPDIKVAYPVKVNYDPALLELIASAGGSFDVASAKEIDLAIQAGGDTERMIFSHTAKLASHMQKAAAAGVRLSIIDSVDEMQKHAKHWPNAEILLRLTVARDDWHLGQKFGASLDEGPELFREARELGLTIRGVHFHVGSLASSASPYLAALEDARVAMDMGSTAGHDMAIVNMGGGFQYPSDSASPLAKHDFLAAAAQIKGAMAKFGDHVEFMAEPGTFMAMASTTIAVDVVSVRNNGAIWVHESTYGSLNALSWPGYKDIVGNSISVLPMGQSEKHYKPAAGSTPVNGITCDWADVINLPVGLQASSLSASDILLFENQGAYSLSCACDFNGYELSSMPVNYIYDSSEMKDGFQVRYKIDAVPDKGWGIVLEQEVKKGEPVWAFKGEGKTHAFHDEATVRAKLQVLAKNPRSHESMRFFLNHIFGWDGRIIELIGDCRFMNHSSTPVIGTTDGETWVALRDLSRGEEIVDNYETYSNPDWYVDLCKEYDVEWASRVAELYN